MTAESHPSPEARAIGALFAVAARDGWRRVSLPAIAAEAGMEADALAARFAGREAIVARFLVDAGRELLDGTLPRAEGETLRDRLFDVVMRAVDIAQRHRAGVIALRRGLRGDPLAAAGLAPVAETTARLMLDAAGVRTEGVSGLLRLAGLMLLLESVSRAWEADETADLGRTMAALDRALNRAEQAEGWMRRLPGLG